MNNKMIYSGFALSFLMLIADCTAITDDADPPDVQQIQQSNKTAELDSREEEIKPNDDLYTESEPDVVYPVTSGSQDEIDSLYGKVVRIYGTISNVDGRHAALKLASGVVVYIAHIDKQVSNLDWFSLIGKEVTVVGKLSAGTDNLIDNKLPGPFLYNVLQLSPGRVVE